MQIYYSVCRDSKIKKRSKSRSSAEAPWHSSSVLHRDPLWTWGQGQRGWKSLRINAWQWKCSCSWKSVGTGAHILDSWYSNTHTHTHTHYCILLGLDNSTSCLTLRLSLGLMVSSLCLLQANMETGATLWLCLCLSPYRNLTALCHHHHVICLQCSHTAVFTVITGQCSRFKFVGQVNMFSLINQLNSPLTVLLQCFISFILFMLEMTCVFQHYSPIQKFYISLDLYPLITQTLKEKQNKVQTTSVSINLAVLSLMNKAASFLESVLWLERISQSRGQQGRALKTLRDQLLRLWCHLTASCLKSLWVTSKIKLVDAQA